MTKDANKKFQFTLCFCSQVFRGGNFKQHVANMVSKKVEAEEKSHGSRDRLLFCLDHREILCVLDDESQKAFHRAHRSCAAPLRLSKGEMKGLFNGKLPEEKKEEKEEKKVEKKEEKEEEKKKGVPPGFLPRHQVDIDEAEEVREATANLLVVMKRGEDSLDSLSPIRPPTKRRKLIGDADDSLFDSEGDEERAGNSFNFEPGMTSTPEDEKEAKEKEEKEEKEKRRIEEAERELRELEEVRNDLAVSDTEEEGEVREAEEETAEEKARREKEQLKADRRKEMAQKREQVYAQKEAARKHREWSKENAPAITQQAAFTDLTNRLKNMTSERDKALLRAVKAESAVLTQQNYQSRCTGLLAEKAEWEDKERTLQKDKERLGKEVEATRKERAQAEKELEKVREERGLEREGRRRAEEESFLLKAENDRLKAALAEHATATPPLPVVTSLRIVGHMACRNGRILKSNFEVEDLNKTVTCYMDDKTTCHHVYLWRDDKGGLKVKAPNTKRTSCGEKHYL